LCFGSAQITMITPRRLMTLHFSQRGLTDADTFTDCLVLCNSYARPTMRPRV
jgi:hypothetical protein